MFDRRFFDVSLIVLGVANEPAANPTIGTQYGILRKISIFILVGMTHVIDHELLGDKVPLRDAVIFFYLANEGLSLIENAVVIGLPVPEILKSKLLEFRKKSEE